MSDSERFEEFVIVIFCSLFVALSLAETLTIPLASISNVTSICGTSRGAGGIPQRGAVQYHLARRTVQGYFETAAGIFHSRQARSA